MEKKKDFWMRFLGSLFCVLHGLYGDIGKERSVGGEKKLGKGERRSKKVGKREIEWRIRESDEIFCGLVLFCTFIFI